MPSRNRAARAAKRKLEKRWREQRGRRPAGWALLAALGLVLVSRGATASSDTASSASGASGPRQASTEARESAGRPRIKLNRLTFPSIPEGSYYKNHLARSLHRETRHADWGAGAGSVIEYRFRVERLDIEARGDVVRVDCAATGELPGGKNAKSRLTFSGDPAKRRELIEKVLTIVARGVVTRLAQIEHARRKS